MSDNFIVNEGDGAKLLPVEAKEPTIVKEIQEAIEKTTGAPAELVTPIVAKKKLGRPKKVVTVHEEVVVRQFRCSTCQESFDDTAIMRLAAGENRYAAFCPNCQKSMGFVDEAFQQKISDLITNNPTGK